MEECCRCPMLHDMRDVERCREMTMDAGGCWPILRDAEICLQLGDTEYSHISEICWDIYWGILRYAEECREILEAVQGDWEILRSAEWFWEILRDGKRCCEILRDVEGCFKHRGMLRDAAEGWDTAQRQGETRDMKIDRQEGHGRHFQEILRWHGDHFGNHFRESTDCWRLKQLPGDVGNDAEDGRDRQKTTKECLNEK